MLAFLDSPLVSSDFGRRRVGLWPTKLLVARETTSCTRGRRGETSLSPHGSKIIGSLSNWTTAAATRTSKLIGLINQQLYNNFARASRLFVHFLLAVVVRLRHETSPFHAPALYSTSEHNTKKIFLFLLLNI